MTILKSDFLKLFFLCSLSFILFLPFINKAVSGDSIFYIYTARQILKQPLRPFDFRINCADKEYPAWDVANNPPAVSYLLAGIIKIFGENEKILHIVFFCFALLSVIALYFLSNELKIDPFVSALLLIASSAFFVNATDIMLDIPLLAFSLWGIYFAIREKYLGWFLLGIAILIKFVAVIYLPIIFVWFLLNKKLKKNFALFLIPVLFLIAWSLQNKLIYGEIQILKKSSAVGLFFGPVKEIPLLTYIGGTFIFPLSILWIAFSLGKRFVWGSVIIFTVADFLFSLLGYPAPQNFLFALFISCAAILIFIIIEKTKSAGFGKDFLFLSIWFFCFFGFFASISAITAVRYLIPALPAAVMIFAKISETIPVRKVFLTVTAAAGIFLSVFISSSDYALANSYRDVARYIKINYADKNVYFTGHLGFQYYMEKNGFLAVDSANKKYPRDSILVVPVLPVPQKIDESVLNKARVIEERYVTTVNPFRTMSPSAQAGFHLNLYGLLPYSLSKTPLEKFTIYKIR